MGDRPAERVSRNIDALFRLGVVTGLSDGRLLERFLARSDAEGQVAFEAIMRRHGPMVLGVCRRVLGHHQAAEDAFQATFMVLALKASAVREREQLGPWLHGVAARIARRALASTRRSQAEPLPSEDPVDRATTHEPAPADLAAVIDEELGRLPDKYRIPVVLCYLEGQTQEQAARTLGWTKGTVSGRLARAKDLLRHRLTRRGLAPSAGLVAAALAPEAASAAVPSPLLTATVRVVVAAVLGGAEAGLASGSVSSLARAALKWMLVARIVRTAALVIVMGTAAATVAAALQISGGPARPDWPARPAAARGVAAVARPAPNPPAPRVDRYGDPLPDRARVRLGTIQRRHSTRVVGVDFALDGVAISMQHDGLARWWDLETGRQVGALDVLGEADPDRAIKAFAISPDGTTLAAAGFAFEPARQRVSHSVWIWELAPRRLRHRLEVETLDLYSLAFAPDGATIATGGFGGDVQLWDVATGARRSALAVGDFPVEQLAFAPDGTTLLATGQGRGITLWDLDGGRGTAMPGLKGSWSTPRFSPNGRLLALPQLGGEIVFRDRTTGEDRLKAPGAVAAFAPDGRAVAITGSGDGTLTVLDTRTGAERWKSDVGWGSAQSGPVFSPDGQTLIVETDGVLRFYEAESGRERLGVPDAHQAGVTVVRYAPDGRTIITAGDDGTLREWDAATARPLRVIPQGGRVDLVAISPDGRSVATGSRAGLRLPGASVAVWDLASGRRRRQWSWTGAILPGDALAFSSGGDTLLVFDRVRGLKVLEVATGQEQPALQPRLNLADRPFPGAMMVGAAFSAGNRWLATRTLTTVRVADLTTGGEQALGPCNAMAFTPDGQGLAIAIPARREEAGPANRRISVGWAAESIRVVGLASGEDRRIEVPREPVGALAVSPDGKVLAVAGGLRRPAVRLYRTSDGGALESFALPAAVHRPGGLAFSPDGRSLAAGLADTTVAIWELSAVD